MQLIDSRHSFIEIFVCVFHICPREHKGFLFINNIYYLPIKIFVSQIHLADTNKFIFGHTVLCLLVAVFYLFILFYFFLNLYLFIYQGGIANFCKPKKKKKLHSCHAAHPSHATFPSSTKDSFKSQPTRLSIFLQSYSSNPKYP